MSNAISVLFSTFYASMAKNPLAQRLQIVMETMGWYQAELAREAGCTRASVTNWMTGFSQKVDPQFAFNLQDRTRFNARWIMYGEGPPRMDLISPDDKKLLEAIAKLSPERRKALTLALDLK